MIDALQLEIQRVPDSDLAVKLARWFELENQWVVSAEEPLNLMSEGDSAQLLAHGVRFANQRLEVEQRASGFTR